MKLFVLAALGAAALSAHTISISNGDVTVRGEHLDFLLTVPLYELGHPQDGGQALLEHIRFSTRGEIAALVEHSCHEDAARALYVCAAEYRFAQPVRQLDVDCTLYQVTVPNHVHILRAENSGKHDQAIFDYSYTRAELRFRPPTAFEVAVQQSFEGMTRAVAGPVQLLFLAALVLAARGVRELAILTLAFLAGEVLVALASGSLAWQPQVRFVEAAMALSIAYLAVEILFMPAAGSRWLIAGVLGGFHGLSLYLILASSGFRPVYVLGGAATAETLVIAALGTAIEFARRHLPVWMAKKMVQAGAALLLIFGATWFFLRLRS